MKKEGAGGMNKKAAAVMVVLVLIIGAVVALGARKNQQNNAAPADPGSKSVLIEIEHGDGTTNEIPIVSDEKWLADALLDEGIVSGEQGSYGLYVLEVDGERADFDKDGKWWKLSVNGEESEKGASQTPLEDGTVYTWSVVSE